MLSVSAGRSPLRPADPPRGSLLPLVLPESGAGPRSLQGNCQMRHGAILFRLSGLAAAVDEPAFVTYVVA